MDQPDLDKLSARIKRLEDAVFPPGGPALFAQLSALGLRIEQIQTEVYRDLKDLDIRQTEKIRKTIEILAEVKSAVDALAKRATVSRTMQSSS